jgi:tetratricopeptide (TPR) repeat protein
MCLNSLEPLAGMADPWGRRAQGPAAFEIGAGTRPLGAYDTPRFAADRAPTLSGSPGMTPPPAALRSACRPAAASLPPRAPGRASSFYLYAERLGLLGARLPAPGHRPLARGQRLHRGARSLALAAAMLLGSVPVGTPAGAQSLAPSQLVPTPRSSSASPLATPAEPARDGIVEGSRDALVRDALLLDFAGYHQAAGDVVQVLRRRDPDDALAALIEVEHRFWPQLYDVGPSRDDPELVAAIATALALAKAQHEANPDDLQARALYGRAMMHDARRLALDGYLMKAGARSEDARAILESVVDAAPDDADARYLLGNYYYWAGVLPSFLKYINWLWFVPQGDRQAGIEMLREVTTAPTIYAESAQVMLSVISSHHTPTNFEDAANRLRPLHRRYPMNVLIQHELVDVLFKMGRYDDLVPLLDEMERRASEPQPVRAYAYVAEMWRARIALHRRQLDLAEEHLALLDAHAEDLPNWTPSWIDVLNAQILDLRGRRKEAVSFYKKAMDRKGLYESQRAERMAKAGLDRPFDPDTFEHPLLLTGE